MTSDGNVNSSWNYDVILSSERITDMSNYIEVIIQIILKS